VRLVCGIDEAGRGPVLGPMVIAGVMMRESRHAELVALGVKDSKLCTPKKREELYEAILRLTSEYHVVVIDPLEIDAALFDPMMNLNLLEIHHQAAIINTLIPDHVIIDCPQINTLSYTSKLIPFLSNRAVGIQAENKADMNHPIVSAASIIAKVTRDRAIESIKKRIGIDFGSGYPGDPKTRRFLEERQCEHDDIKRKSWQTYKTIRDKG
jgi:ribonuclease HII